MAEEFILTKKDNYVDIHGREITTLDTGKRGEEACLLGDLKQTGVAIYRKSQYAKLSATNPDFGPDFADFMLEQAKSYMLSNKISFTHDQIMNSIESAKQVLTANKSTTPHEENKILKDRVIETGSDNEIHIRVSNITPPPKPTTPLTQRSPQLKNFSLRLPRQPPIGKETEPDSDRERKSFKDYPQKKFPPRSSPVERKTEYNVNNKPESSRKSLGGEANVNNRPENSRKSLGGEVNVNNRPESSRRSQGGASKPYQPRNETNKKFSYNYNGEKKEHDVMITRIDKSNCVWVRDLANNGLFEQIHKKVNEEAGRQPLASEPWKMDKIYMAKEEGAWFRCKVVKERPLTVFFVDYGNIAQVDEIKDLSEELAKIPCMAIRITFKQSNYEPQLEEELRIRPFMQNNDGTYFVNILTDKSNPTTRMVDVGMVASVSPVTENGNEDNWEEDEEKPKKTENVAFKPKKPESVVFPPKRTTRISEAARLGYVNPVTGNENEDNWEGDTKLQTKENVSFTPKKTEKTAFFKKPPPLCAAANDQRVAIVAEENGEFFLRTKECFHKLEQIEKLIEDYFKSAETVENPQVDQLVLYEDKDGKVHRAIVTKIDRNGTEIELLDYFGRFAVKKGTVKSIDERLSKEPITYFSGGKLLGFEEEPLDENAKKIVEECVEKRQKFTVVFGFDDELDLFDGEELLSEKLKKVEDNSGKIFLKDMKTFTPESGVKPYLCGCYKSSTHFSLVSSEELQKHIDSVLRCEIEDDVPYTPVEKEICLAYFVDNWYRCVVTRIFDKECEVLLLDFGNIELIKKEDLRAPDDDFTKVPLLGLPCVLTGLPQHDKVEDLLRKMIINGELYNADVKGISEGKWQVEIPSVYKNLRENKQL